MQPYLGQIMMFAFKFAPRGWALCDGQTLQISQNQSLYSLLGTMYGGDGVSNFKLPDLRGRLPMQADTSNPIGVAAGAEGVSINQSQMGRHAHSIRGSSNPASASAAGNVLGTNAGGGRGSVIAYREPANTANLQPLEIATIGLEGQGAPHDNIQPSLIVNFCINISGGLFPPRN